MAKLRVGSKGKISVAVAGMIGAIISLVMSVLLTVALTNLILKGSVEDKTADIFIFAIRTLSVLLGCVAGSLLTDGKLLQVIGLSALGYLLILLATGIVLFDGSFQGFWIGILSVIMGAVVAILIKSTTLRSNKHKKFRRK